MTRNIRRKIGANRYQSCERKRGRWDTKEDAQKALDVYRKDNPWSLKKVVYLCPWGDDHYHFGAPLDRRER